MITTVWTESSWAFSESYTATENQIRSSSNSAQTKGLRTPSPRWASAQLLCVHNSDQDSVVRIFAGLSFELMFLYSHYIILHNFFPYRCNQQMTLLTFQIVLCCLRSTRPWLRLKKLALPDCMISHFFCENANPVLRLLDWLEHLIWNPVPWHP